MRLVAVAAPVRQPLERGLGGLPVTAAAGYLPAGFGAQQPLRVDLLPPVRPHRPLHAFASAMSPLTAAVIPALPPGPVGSLADEPSGRCRRPPIPSHPPPAMLRRPCVVEAIGAPIAVQFRGGHAPHCPLLWVGGHGAEFGQQPSRRVQGQGMLVDPAPPGILLRHRPLPDAQLFVVGFHPAQVPLLRPSQDAEPLGRLVGLPAGGLECVLGQHQPLPGSRTFPTPPASF